MKKETDFVGATRSNRRGELKNFLEPVSHEGGPLLRDSISVDEPGSAGYPGKSSSEVVVSVVVPTFNSAETIEECVASASSQEVATEIIVVDAFSNDSTIDRLPASVRLIRLNSGMTRARLVGTTQARGRFVVNMDSDMALMPGALRQAVDAGKDIVAFGEVTPGKGLIASLTRVERSAEQADWKRELDFEGGSLRPRFYSRELLLRALLTIPEDVLDIRPCPLGEDTMIFAAARKYSSSMAFVPHGMIHREGETVWRFAKKWYRYGQAARRLTATASHQSFVRSYLEARFPRLLGPTPLPLVLIKGIPFVLGFYGHADSPTVSS